MQHREALPYRLRIAADVQGMTLPFLDGHVRQGNALIGTEETAARVKQSGVDAVIIGNAA